MDATGIHTHPTLKLGRRPPKNAPALRLGSFLRAGVVPEHPVAADHLGRLVTVIVVWAENVAHPAFQQGIDLAALTVAYEGLTGRPFPAQGPPAPAPSPPPPVPAPQV